ncbi:hypothetical protein [Paenibacillus sp. sgz302251]|uniref:hypothetical protein n=1 Tax=Paenibacillus sp. sgz302251 TaxID=3414493 RepID=UPI003C7D906A
MQNIIDYINSTVMCGKCSKKYQKTEPDQRLPQNCTCGHDLSFNREIFRSFRTQQRTKKIQPEKSSLGNVRAIFDFERSVLWCPNCNHMYIRINIARLPEVCWGCKTYKFSEEEKNIYYNLRAGGGNFERSFVDVTDKVADAAVEGIRAFWNTLRKK